MCKRGTRPLWQLCRRPQAGRRQGPDHDRRPFAALGGAAVGQAAQIAGLVKQGVDSILGLGETKLQLGVSDTFYAGNPLRGGIQVGIAARPDDVPTETLWLRQGRLVKGGDPISA